MMGDAVWIERARAGDAEAFGGIFRRYGPRIRAHCYGIIGNAADADDLTQETFLRAYRALGNTTATLSLRAWLDRIATNACTDLLRRRRTAHRLPWEEGFHERPTAGREENPETALLDAEALRTFGAVCGALRPQHRHVLLLRARDGYSLEQIGAQLGLTMPAVKSLLFRARGEYREVAAR